MVYGMSGDGMDEPDVVIWTDKKAGILSKYLA